MSILVTEGWEGVLGWR